MVFFCRYSSSLKQPLNCHYSMCLMFDLNYVTYVTDTFLGSVWYNCSDFSLHSSELFLRYRLFVPLFSCDWRKTTSIPGECNVRNHIWYVTLSTIIFALHFWISFFFICFITYTCGYLAINSFSSWDFEEQNDTNSWFFQGSKCVCLALHVRQLLDVV